MGQSIEEVLESALARIADLERRASRTILHGKVAEVDEKKKRVRIEIGEDDGEPQKSAWIPYSQVAGDMKIHSMPSVGQQMTVFNPDGVPEQALAFPMIWSNDNKSPSDKKDEHVMTFGEFKGTLTKEKMTMAHGKNEVEITKNAAKLKNGGNVIFVDGSGCWSSKPIEQKDDPK